MIPTNAQAIVDARAKGFKPDELILVSMIGRINEPNHTVYASASRDYEWSWARGLQVCIYTTSGIDWVKVATGLKLAKTEYLALWDAGRSEGAELWYWPHVDTIHKPRSQWKWIFSYMPWTSGQNERFLCN